MINKLKIYTSKSTDPYENLAIEKYLSDSVEDGCLILYLWQNQNTVVIGKNQNPWSECRIGQLVEDGGKLARRLSGGGAVFHDLGNLNFTFISTTSDLDIKKNLDIIRSACELAGISTEFSGRNDLLAEGKKFSGNAFYNSKGKSYHHGTLLISTDISRLNRYLTPPEAKLQAKGIKSVASRVVNLCELAPDLNCETMKKHMISAISSTYGIEVETMESIDNKIIKPLQDKYSSWDFLYGKVLPFTMDLSAQLSFGNLKLLLQVTNGVIDTVQCFTDAMDTSIVKKICTALTNCPLKPDLLKIRLLDKLSGEYAEEILQMMIEKTM